MVKSDGIRKDLYMGLDEEAVKNLPFEKLSRFKYLPDLGMHFTSPTK